LNSPYTLAKIGTQNTPSLFKRRGLGMSSLINSFKRKENYYSSCTKKSKEENAYLNSPYSLAKIGSQNTPSLFKRRGRGMSSLINSFKRKENYYSSCAKKSKAEYP
jgi:hypothetical protein